MELLLPENHLSCVLPAGIGFNYYKYQPACKCFAVLGTRFPKRKSAPPMYTSISVESPTILTSTLSAQRSTRRNRFESRLQLVVASAKCNLSAPDVAAPAVAVEDFSTEPTPNPPAVAKFTVRSLRSPSAPCLSFLLRFAEYRIDGIPETVISPGRTLASPDKHVFRPVEQSIVRNPAYHIA